MIDLKKIYELIVEINKFVKDIPLFFCNGKKYFEKIKNEDSSTNAYRLIMYIILSSIIKTFLLSVNLSFDFNLLESARLMIFQFVLISIGYFIALSFSGIPSKITTCLNYVIFQNTITILIPILLLAVFIHSEVYFFYILYIISLIAFFLFILLKFALLFFKSKLKRALSILTILITLATIVLTVIYLDIPLANSKVLVAFEDPIASEFFELGYMDEISGLNTELDAMEVTDVIYKINNKLSSGVRLGDITYIVESGQISKLSYNWNLRKQKEYKIANTNIEKLAKKLNNAQYNRTKKLIYQMIKINQSYIDILDEYEITITTLADIDYNNLYQVNTHLEKISTDNAEEYVNKIKEMSVVNSNLEKFTKSSVSAISLNEKIKTMIQEKINLSKDTSSYLEGINKIKKYLPMYLYGTERLNQIAPTK